MADHPAIVALAHHLGGFGHRPLHEDTPEGEKWVSIARAAYAAVLKDMLLPSEAMIEAIDPRHGARGTQVTREPVFTALEFEAMLRARAREIGVEI